jgi:5-methylcytosine-specific restriction endonuclease McrA
MCKGTCTIDGCDKKVHCKGLCPMHYQRLRKNGSLQKPPPRTKPSHPPCGVDGCEVPGNRKGMCVKHYARAWHEANWAETYAKAKARREANREQYLSDGRSYYQRNRERILAQQASDYALNPEKKRAAARRWRAANRERVLEKKREHYRRNRAAYADRGRAYYAANKERLRASNRAWIQANRERYRAASREWRKRNALLRKEAEMRRRARMRGNRVTKADYEAILVEHGMFCHICSLVIVDESDLHFDHVVPLALGGPHSPDNIKPAHAICNMRKGGRAA